MKISFQCLSFFLNNNGVSIQIYNGQYERREMLVKWSLTTPPTQHPPFQFDRCCVILMMRVNHIFRLCCKCCQLIFLLPHDCAVHTKISPFRDRTPTHREQESRMKRKLSNSFKELLRTVDSFHSKLVGFYICMTTSLNVCELLKQATFYTLVGP